MREPEFSEAQLQSAANGAFALRLISAGMLPAFVHVPSLPAEFTLGWDSAMYLPWLLCPANPEHMGCNFFVQYKLSVELNTPGAKEWSCWGTDYLRFKIPHSYHSHNAGGSDDFHQWERLKALADQGYPTFYATNAVLTTSQLEARYTAGTLLDAVPLLDIRPVAQRHKHVTFVRGSADFLLHSDIEKRPLRSFAESLSLLSQERQQGFAEGTQQAILALQKVASTGQDNGFGHELRALADGPIRDNWVVTRLAVARLTFRRLGAHLLWCPTGG
jgi:hypothetical protein